jgi:cysteine-rich CPXCG protein
MIISCVVLRPLLVTPKVPIAVDQERTSVTFSAPLSRPIAAIIAVGSPQVSDEFLVTCPFCGEQVEIYVEPDVNGSFVQDCEVCCNPWRVHVSGRDEDRAVHVTRADGSE